MNMVIKIKGRYYAVKFYNHEKIYVMYFNGKNFEAFTSEQMPNDEIESYRSFSTEHLQHIKNKTTTTMNIQVKDYVGFPVDDTFNLVRSLLDNRKPKGGSFNYGLETHGMFGFVLSLKLDYPIQVSQTNKRSSDKSPIVITIKKHIPLF